MFKVRDDNVGDFPTTSQSPSESDEALDESYIAYFSEYIETPSTESSSSTIFDYYDDSYISAPTYPEESFCAEVTDDIFYYFSFLFDDSSYSSFASSSPDSTSFTGAFDKDTVNGHGTWTAGIATGAISPGSPYLTQDCTEDQLPACAGECVLSSDVDELQANDYFDLDTYCPVYDCDGNGAASSNCLGDDPLETLVQHGGVAPGAQLSMFDVSYGPTSFYVMLAGNFVWNATDGTGSKIHSNSWGIFTKCTSTEFEFLYETFMFEVCAACCRVNDSDITCWVTKLFSTYIYIYMLV